MNEINSAAGRYSKGVEMKKLTLVIASIVAMSAGSALAKGGGGGTLLGVNIFYDSGTSQIGSAAATKFVSTDIDVNLGYVMSNGLYLGAIYVTDSFDTGLGYTPSITAYGASVGYHHQSGWFIDGHYLLSAEYAKFSTATDKWNKGSGIQVDGGYGAALSNNFMLGVELSYTSMTFTNYNNGTVDSTTNKYVKTELQPKIRLTFMF